MKHHRTTQQILVDVMTIASEDSHVPITKLCRKSNLSYNRLKGFLNNLTSSGLMNKIEYDGKNTFVVTARGRQCLEAYKSHMELVESFGLEI
mgnify:CR=1 FL=1|tara:strand:+ start:3363 stop:3638 length:276 start_codon:yes stop_codon:yes gene_type:complete